MSWIWRLLLTLGLIQALALRVTLCRSIHTDHGPRHQASHRRLRNARIKAIKEEILTKLGMTDAPSVRNVSVTVEEQRSKIKLFKKSLEDTYGQIHELFSQEEFLAKQFHSFSQSGKYMIFILSSYCFCLLEKDSLFSLSNCFTLPEVRDKRCTHTTVTIQSQPKFFLSVCRQTTRGNAHE